MGGRGIKNLKARVGRKCSISRGRAGLSKEVNKLEEYKKLQCYLSIKQEHSRGGSFRSESCQEI